MTRASLPKWQRERLAEMIEADAGKVRAGPCNRCGREVLRGQDMVVPRITNEVTVDAHEVDQLGELLATLRGARTYNFTKLGGRWELSQRWPEHIKPERKWPVLVAHDCAVVNPPAVQTHPLLMPALRLADLIAPPF